MEVVLVLGLLLGFRLFTFLPCLNGRMQTPRLAAMAASAILSLPVVLGGLTSQDQALSSPACSLGEITHVISMCRRVTRWVSRNQQEFKFALRTRGRLYFWDAHRAFYRAVTWSKRGLRHLPCRVCRTHETESVSSLLMDEETGAWRGYANPLQATQLERVAPSQASNLYPAYPCTGAQIILQLLRQIPT